MDTDLCADTDMQEEDEKKKKNTKNSKQQFPKLCWACEVLKVDSNNWIMTLVKINQKN